MECLGFPVYSIMSSVNSDDFTFPFQIGCLLFLFPFLTDIGRTCNNMLNKSSENGHPYLVLDIREKVFRSSQWSMMLAVVLSHMDFIMLRDIPLYLFC